MMADSMNKDKHRLAIGIKGLCCIVPITNLLKDAINREFNNFSQSEAYEVLRYLLFVCGVKFCINEHYLSYIGHPSFKDLPSDQKVIVEKLKADILQELHSFLKKSRIDLILRKSDLIAPSQAKYLKCALLLTNTALNHQLKNLGINIPPDSQLTKIAAVDFNKMLEDMREEMKKLEVDNHQYKEVISRYQCKILALQKEVLDFKVLKSKIGGLIEEKIKSCPNEIMNSSISYEDKAKYWSNEVDKLALRNRTRLRRLEGINTNLSDVQSFIDGNTNLSFIDFKNLSHLLSPETLQFSKDNDIKIVRNGQLDLKALLEVVLHSIPKGSLLDENHTKEILETKFPTKRANNLLEKLNFSLKKYEQVLEEARSSLVGKVDKENINEWFNDIFISIPELNFNRNVAQRKKLLCNPFILKKVRDRFY